MNTPLGLSTRSAEALQKQHGPNEVVPSKLESRLLVFRGIMLDPMGLMLLGLAVLYWILGERTDALILAGAFVPVTGVDVLLNIKAERALRALKASIQNSAKVYRDGKIKILPTRDLVPGDLLVFEEGQVLPADGKVVDSLGLGVNEAALTGESLPVEKSPGMDFFCGTSVVEGRGLGEVAIIGARTRYGRIAGLVGTAQSEQSPLQRVIHRTVKKILLFALFLAVILFFLEWSRRGAWVQSLVVALTFAMSAIPEEFPLVFTLYLSLGAYRLSKQGVLVKSLPSVETLGGVDVICTDKTGTLTEGKFRLKELVPVHSGYSRAELERAALMACESHPIDSMEQAIHEAFPDRAVDLKEWSLKWDYPFDLEKKVMSHVWEKATTVQIAMKGAVEGVLNQCALSEQEHREIKRQAEALSSKGNRLLGLALRNFSSGEGGSTGNRTQDEANLQFVGLLVFQDPVRSSVGPALVACQNAGIEIKILTGDHPLTTQAVAEKIGIKNRAHQVFRGDELSLMSEEERGRAYQEGVIFARMSPTQKYELVKALKVLGKTVAMTGDGINDAPALKLADIGICMGEGASDVARASARMVLMKSDFAGIVAAVFEGKRIFSNLKRSFSYLVSFHVPVVLLVLIPAMMGWGEFLLPVHIVFLEMIVHPVSAFAFENLPAREVSSGRELLGKPALFQSVLQGVTLSLFSLFFFRFEEPHGLTQARALGLAIVLFGNGFFVLSESWPIHNQRVRVTNLLLLSLTLGVFEWPVLSNFFHLSVLSGRSLALAFVLGALASVPSGILRAFQKKRSLIRS
jgi:Ca2+-transporting ATPase